MMSGLNRELTFEFYNIESSNLTKSEIISRKDEWSKKLPLYNKMLYDQFIKLANETKYNILNNFNRNKGNLSREADDVHFKIQQVLNDYSLTREEEAKELDKILSNSSLKVQEELTLPKGGQENIHQKQEVPSSSIQKNNSNQQNSHQVPHINNDNDGNHGDETSDAGSTDATQTATKDDDNSNEDMHPTTITSEGSESDKGKLVYKYDETKKPHKTLRLSDIFRQLNIFKSQDLFQG